MKVSELIKKLGNLPDDLHNCEIIIQKDAEGNGYSPLVDIDEDVIYVPKTTYSGDVIPLDWNAKDAGFENEEEWEEFKCTHKRAIVFLPVN